jgi:hypothetical protein
LITAIVLSSSGGNGSGAGTSVGDPVVADAAAQEEARTAQTAIETFAIDHNRSYAAATPAELAAIEPTLEGVDLSVAPTDGGYSVAVTSESGAAFSITRAATGTVTRTCSQPAVGGCSAGGIW